MGITLTSNFDVNAALPLDSRMVVADLTARDAIAAGRRFQGMCVYVVSDTLTYQLKTGILNTDWVEYGGGSGGAAVTYVETFSGDNSTLLFTLASDPLAIENTQVYVHGVYQQKTIDYTLSTTDITFVVAPPIGTDNIEVVYTTPVSPLVIPDNYITTVHIADDAVTDEKIVSMDAAKLTGDMSGNVNILIGDNVLVGSKLANNSIPASAYEDSSITTGKIDNNSITQDKMDNQTFAFSSVFSGSTIGTTFVDVAGSSITFTKGAANQNKYLIIEVIPNVSSSVSYITANDFEVQLLRGSTVIGIVRFTGSTVNDRPITMFRWIEQSGQSIAQTYKLQFRTLTGASSVSFTNAKLCIHYA